MNGFVFDLFDVLPPLAEAPLPVEVPPLRAAASIEQAFLWDFQSAVWHSRSQYMDVWHFAQRLREPPALLHLLHLNALSPDALRFSAEPACMDAISDDVVSSIVSACQWKYVTSGQGDYRPSDDEGRGKGKVGKAGKASRKEAWAEIESQLATLFTELQ